MVTCRFSECLRDDLFAAERHHHNRADVRMPAIGFQRLVGHAHVGSELPAAGQVRQRDAERWRGGGHPFRDQR